ncbi:MAG: hypothetical protein ACRCTA_03065, partial [Bacilli bacterium]
MKRILLFISLMIIITSIVINKSSITANEDNDINKHYLTNEGLYLEVNDVTKWMIEHNTFYIDQSNIETLPLTLQEAIINQKHIRSNANSDG